MTKVQENISKALGVSYEKIKNMNFEEIEKIIELKSGKQMNYSKISDNFHMNSGHDSTAIDQNKIRTLKEINYHIDKAIIDYDRSL